MLSRYSKYYHDFLMIFKNFAGIRKYQDILEKYCKIIGYSWNKISNSDNGLGEGFRCELEGILIF